MSTSLSQLSHEPVTFNPYGDGESYASDRHPNENDDDYLLDYETRTYAVFDGSGQHDGRTAAHMGVTQVYEHYQSQPGLLVPIDVACESMRKALSRVHETVKEATGEDEVSAAALHFFTSNDGAPYAAVGHNGDSRVYRLRSGWRIGSLTLDRSIAHQEHDEDKAWHMQDTLSDATAPRDLPEQGRPPLRQRVTAGLVQTIRNHRHAQDPTVVRAFEVAENDRFLLTTDGIHANLTTDEIQEILKGTYDPKQAATELVEHAFERSVSTHMRATPDDMTAVVVNFPRM